MTDLVLVTGADCRLCERARALLRELGLDYREVDLADPEAGELAGRGVPVVFFPVLVAGTRVLGYGALTRAEVEAALAGDPA